ncbi:L-threonine dehydratase catabolic tdcb-like [Plakobranchus ocellatus]|uniref:L-serine ammonia-lyase n=1 Tax=Plakobranchus ocellatus TaxID=259542 RepID=A0AAV4B6T1_9GAST|nr:L-threonine dehydratase catabolic tdcb-like [Plakobranchus ocellatus]
MNFKTWFSSDSLKISKFQDISKKILLDPLTSRIISGLESTYQRLEIFGSQLAATIEQIMMDDSDLVTLEQIKEAHSYLKSQTDMVRTPTLMHVQSLFEEHLSHCKPGEDIDLFMKMENMQTTGSFKIRGVLNQMRKVEEHYGEEAQLVTMSAGNYGKAFAHCLKNRANKSVCYMPVTTPKNRVATIEGMGVEVRQAETEELQPCVDRLVAKEGYIMCHSFDDVDLIAGYGSSAFELLQDVPDPDIVLVCCGGGGLVSGVAATLSLTGHRNCRVYAVEPEGAASMKESFKARRPVKLSKVSTVAGGLAPPYAGAITYKHCHWFVQDVLVVTDAEILEALKALYTRGIRAEPSGCAALAALFAGKVPDVAGKKVVVYVTGGNVSCTELRKFIGEEES